MASLKLDIAASTVALAFVTIGSLTGCFHPSPMGPERATRLWIARRLNGSNGVAAKSFNGTASKETAVRTLTSQQAIAIALQKSPLLRKSRLYADSLRGKGQRETALDNPEFRLRNVDIDRLSDGDPEMELALRVPIPNPWMQQARSQHAKLQLDEAQARQRDVVRKLRSAIGTLYAHLAMLNKQVASYDDFVSLTREYSTRAIAQVKEGLITQNTSTALQLQHAKALRRQYSLQQRRKQIISRLRELIGIESAQSVTFRCTQADLAVHTKNIDIEALKRRALRNRHDLRASAALVGKAEADLYIAKTKRLPWLKFAEVSYNASPDATPRDFEVAFAVTLPFLSLNSGAIATCEASLARKRLDEAILVSDVTNKVQSAAQRIRDTAALVHELKRGLTSATLSTESDIATAISKDEMTPLRAVRLASRKFDAIRQYLAALLEHRKAVIDLEAAVGVALAQ